MIKFSIEDISILERVKIICKKYDIQYFEINNRLIKYYSLDGSVNYVNVNKKRKIIIHDESFRKKKKLHYGKNVEDITNEGEIDEVAKDFYNSECEKEVNAKEKREFDKVERVERDFFNERMTHEYDEVNVEESREFDNDNIEVTMNDKVDDQKMTNEREHEKEVNTEEKREFDNENNVKKMNYEINNITKQSTKVKNNNVFKEKLKRKVLSTDNQRLYEIINMLNEKSDQILGSIIVENKLEDIIHNSFVLLNHMEFHKVALIIKCYEIGFYTNKIRNILISDYDEKILTNAIIMGCGLHSVLQKMNNGIYNTNVRKKASTYYERFKRIYKMYSCFPNSYEQICQTGHNISFYLLAKIGNNNEFDKFINEIKSEASNEIYYDKRLVYFKVEENIFNNLVQNVKKYLPNKK